ncbi:MAG TPA: ABC transporter permease, partial [Gemmatimonadaceae bacterium]
MREQRPSTPVLERLFSGHHDILAALRSLRRSPGFVAIAVLSLGLAIGLNTTMLAMVDAIMHPYVPYMNADRLYDLTPYGITREGEWLQGPMFLAVRARKDLYAQLVPYAFHNDLIQADGHLVTGFTVTVGTRMFDALGVKPVLGRSFNTAPDNPGAADAAIIGYQIWQENFGGTTDLNAMHLTISGRTYSVIGVMPPSVHYPFFGDVWLPMSNAREASADSGWFRALLVLKPGDTQARVKSQLDAMAKQFVNNYHGDPTQFDYRLETVIPKGEIPRQQTLIAALITVLVLLVACLNLANLMLARGLGRRRELAVRMAIGASRGAIVRHVLVECALIAVLGGLWGILLSVWGVKLAEGHMPGMIRQLGFVTPHLSWRVLAIGIAVTAGTVLVAGLAPSLNAARANVGEVMKDGGGSSTGRHSRLYRVVVVGEVAVALGVTIFSMIALVDYYRQATVHFSYDVDHILVSGVQTGQRCDSMPGSRQLWFDMARRLDAVPGVRAAALFDTYYPAQNVVTSDQPGIPQQRVLGRGLSIGYIVTTPDYFRVYGYPIIAGRDFQPGDADSGGVAIVNRELAKKMWPLMSPVGRLLKLGASKSNAPWVRVIGIVGSRVPDADSASDDSPLLTVARPFSCRAASAVVRTVGTRRDVASAAYHVVRAAVPPAAYVAEFRSAKEDYEASLRSDRLATLALVSCGLFALLLSAVGVYGVLSYAVGQRTREFAMRTALGAQSPHLIKIVVRDALEMVLGGTALGGAVAV